MLDNVLWVFNYLTPVLALSYFIKILNKIT